MAYYIGVDIGTSGTKTVLFTAEGKTVASAAEEYPLYQPQNGYAEQEPADWWRAVRQTISEVVESSGVDNREIKGIGLSGQMHGLVMLDQDGNVLRRSIIWCDQRTAEECEEITRKVGRDRLIAVTANPALTGFTASKILWVRNHEPEIYARCAKILLPKDYIRYMLTGEYATEVSDASGMQLLDVPGRCWSREILDKLSIDPALLGRVYESPEVTGRVTRQAAALTGLAEGTVVVGGAGDNAAAAVGTGTVENGRAFTTIGTSGVVYAHSSKLAIDPLGRVHTFCCAVPGAWHVMGVTQGAGLSLKWFRDMACSEEKAQAERLNVDPYVVMDSEASQSPIGSNRLLYLPYLMGERTPHLDPNARGVFFGLSAMHTRSDLIRSVMEGVAFSLNDCREVITGMGIRADDMTACGGGGRSPLWRQMLADIFNCPVKTSNSKEGPALGVAILAMVGAGEYASVEEACHAILGIDRIQQPVPGNHERYLPYYRLYCELYPALQKEYASLAALN